MIALKLLLVVALAFTANAQGDLEQAYKLSECLKKTMDGLPSAQIPSHNPLKFDDLSWHVDYQGVRSTLNLSNIEWHGIPDWFANFAQESKDSDSVAVLPFGITFPHFKIQLNYTLDAVLASTPIVVAGDLHIFMTDTNWGGEVKYNKPGFNLTEGIENLDLKWTVKQIEVFFNGLGRGYNELASKFVSVMIGSIFTQGPLNDVLGPALKDKLNTDWFDHRERIDAVLEFCKGN